MIHLSTHHSMPHYLRYFAVKYGVIKMVSTVTQDTDFTKACFTLNGTPVNVTSFTAYSVPIFTMLIAQQHYVQIFYIEFRRKRTITVESNSRNSFKPYVKHGLHGTQFHEIQSFSMNYTEFWYRISQKSVQNMGSTGRNSFTLF
jgi:hypothetical protein